MIFSPKQWLNTLCMYFMLQNISVIKNNKNNAYAMTLK
jgi:hypothetical protein